MSTLAGKIDDIPFYLMEMPITERTLEIRSERPIICPLCGNGWVNQVPTNAKVLLSNYMLFPNSACHQGCIHHAGGMQAAAEKIKDMYDECKSAKEKFIKLGWMGA